MLIENALRTVSMTKHFYKDYYSEIALNLANLYYLVVALAMALPIQGLTQDYPTKPIRLVVPFAPGGTTDILARLIGEKLRAKWGQPVIVENRAGATGNIGTELVSRAAPDGYTLLFTPGGPLVLNRSLFAKLPFDPDAFVPIGLIARIPNVLVVNPELKMEGVQQLINFAKANPDKLNYSSQGIGSVAHLVAESFKAMANVKIVHIPYKGSAPALAAVLSGEASMGFLELSGVLQHVQAGKLHVLAVGSEKRNPFLPNVPALSEVLPGFVSISWFGMVAPPATPPAITAKLSAAIVEILKQPDLEKWLRDRTLEGIGGSPAEMATFMREDKGRYERLIRTLGITPE